MSRFSWKPYVPVHKRRAAAQRKMKQLEKQGQTLAPVKISGRKIAHTFWGEAWCNHLEQFSDYENRLPRGRTYARNGSVCHLGIGQGTIEAMVSGSQIYNITIAIKPLPAGKWKKVREQCTGQIGSMLELLQGKFSHQVMQIVTHRDHGLFPNPGEIEMQCNCPDWAGLCKHLAAVLYGVGARLDQQPELLFKLRGVDHQELITGELNLTATATGSGSGSGKRRLDDDDLSGLFGVEIDVNPAPPIKSRPVAVKAATARSAKNATAKVSATVKAKTVKKATIKTASGNKATVKKATAKAVTVKRLGVKKGGTKNVATKRIVAKPASAKPSSSAGSAAARKPFIPTVDTVVALRKHLGMNKSQFARLIGISPPTIGHWEKREGLLTPSPEVLKALEKLAVGATKGTARGVKKKKK